MRRQLHNNEMSFSTVKRSQVSETDNGNLSVSYDESMNFSNFNANDESSYSESESNHNYEMHS